MCSKHAWMTRLLKFINFLQVSSFCCIANLRQGTLLIAVIELVSTHKYFSTVKCSTCCTKWKYFKSDNDLYTTPNNIFFQTLTAFVLFLLLLGATHIQDIVDLVSADLQQLEENSWSLGSLEGLSWYFTNNERKMITGQQLASRMLSAQQLWILYNLIFRFKQQLLIVFFFSVMMEVVYSGLIITCIHFISCLLLLYGALRNLAHHLLPWISFVLLSIVTGCFFMLMLAFLPTQECKIGTFLTGFTIIGLEIYSWLVVFNYYRELKSWDLNISRGYYRHEVYTRNENNVENQCYEPY